MTFLSAIFRAADLILAGAQVVDRGIDAGKKIARKLRRPTEPSEPSQPLTYRDVAHQQDQIRSATEDFRGTDTQRLPRVSQMRPPPLKRR